MDKKPFHEVVAENLIEQLRRGAAPWQTPSQPGEPSAVLPMNPTTGKRYKGINALHLMGQSRADRRWMTYKQAVAAGAQVRKGEKGTPVQYWKFTEEQQATDEAGRPMLDGNGKPFEQTVRLERPRVFMATVFNAEQIDGLQPIQPRTKQDWNPVERAERILRSSGAVIQHAEQNRAFYRPASDSIHMPERGQFPTAEGYYSIALHELGHWTGHPDRLNRDLAHPFGSAGYAKEELRAEIASLILGDELGLGHDPAQHVAYVAAWIDTLTNDPLEIFRAAADAEKIQAFVLGLEQQQTQQQTSQQAAAIAAPLEASMNNISAGQTAYEGELARLLQLSTLTPGSYAPSEAVKSGTHAAVFVGDTAMILCGPHDDPTSIAQAEALAASAHLAAVYRAAGLSGPIRGGVVAGAHIPWAAIEAGVVSKPSGQAEPGGQEGPLIAVVLNDPTHAVTTNLCVTTETARILDAAAPELDDGHCLPALAHGATAESSDVHGDNPLETWTLMRIEQGTLMSALKAMDDESIDHIRAALYAVMPLNTDNPFWHRHTLPYDVESIEEASEKALEYIEGFPEKRSPEQLVKRREPAGASEAPDIGQAAHDARANEMKVRGAEGAADEEISAAKEIRKSAEVRTMQPLRTFIDVPFKQKDEAKALGAKWDRQQQSWYVPDGIDSAAFDRWAKLPIAPASGASPQPQINHSQDRHYLAVPFGEREAAKAAGARWDAAAKSWYAGPTADLGKLDRWKLDPSAAAQHPAMSPREEFADALRSLKCVVAADHPIMDGQKHRISVEGENHSAISGSGVYGAHLDGHPAGYIKNNKSGIEMKWKAKGYSLDAERKAQLGAEAATKLQARAAEQQQLHEQTAQRVRTQLDGLKPVEQPTAYLAAKGIQCHPGAFTDAEGKTTYIPAVDAENRLWTMQYIREDGTKRFAKNSHKEGCFHAIGGLDALSKAPAIVIAEGYATAATLAESLGFTTVAAFDSGNLAPVAKALKAKFPDKPFVIAGDDDQHLVPTLGVNPGRTKMEEAARAVGGVKLLPIFAPGERDANPTAFTDFNDLATKSIFGRDAVARQARAVVDLAARQGLSVGALPDDKRQVQHKDKRRASMPTLDSNEPRRRRTVAKM